MLHTILLFLAGVVSVSSIIVWYLNNPTF